MQKGVMITCPAFSMFMSNLGQLFETLNDITQKHRREL